MFLRQIFIVLISFLLITQVTASTRILYAQPGRAVLVGNNMDWYEDMKPNLVVYPRGLPRDGDVPGNSLKWYTKYGSIVTTAYDGVTTSGMNENGLAAHLLEFKDTDYGTRNQKLAGVAVYHWAQFYLDKFHSVKEAVRYTRINPFQIIDESGGLKLHLALEDSTGDSAILEYINGELKIYQDYTYTVLTDEPALNQQLENLKQYDGFGGDKPVPGTDLSPDRFVRASYYLTHLPAIKTDNEAIFKLFGALQNTSKIDETLWRTVSDLSNRIYYFNSTSRFNTFWVDIKKFNLYRGQPVMKLELAKNPNLSGEVSGYFKENNPAS